MVNNLLMNASQEAESIGSSINENNNDTDPANGTNSNGRLSVNAEFTPEPTSTTTVRTPAQLGDTLVPTMDDFI